MGTDVTNVRVFFTQSAWPFSPQAPARPSVTGPARAETVCSAVRHAGRALARGGNTLLCTAQNHAPPTRRHTSRPCRPVLHRLPAPTGLWHTHRAGRVRQEARAVHQGLRLVSVQRRQQRGHKGAGANPLPTHFGAVAACAARCCTAARQRRRRTQEVSPLPAFPQPATTHPAAGCSTLTAGHLCPSHCAFETRPVRGAQQCLPATVAAAPKRPLADAHTPA